MDEGLDEVIAEFVTEAQEHLEDIENEILDIEACGEELDLDLVNKVFRAIHSIKGAAGFLGLASIGNLSHQLENVLNVIRSGELVPDSAVVDVMLRSADILRAMIDDIATSNDVDVSEIVGELESALTGDSDVERDQDEVREPGSLVVTEDLVSEYESRGIHVYRVSVSLENYRQERDKNLRDLVEVLDELGEILDSAADISKIGGLADLKSTVKLPLFLILASKRTGEEIADLLDIPESDVERLGERDSSEPAEPGVQEPQSAEVPDETPLPEEKTEPRSPSRPEARTPDQDIVAQTLKTGEAKVEANIRVPVTLLDHLMNLAGELVLGRNQLLQSTTTKDLRSLEQVSAKLDLVTREMQEAIMRTRLQRVGNVFDKFPRVVRDLSKKLGKNAQLIVEGRGVELDKTIIESISDPLTHLVRNSLDHGVETPEVRRASGKPVTGKITLKAFHENGKVNLSMSDDGAGIDPERLRRKVIENGVMTAEAANQLSDREAIKLIFMPGLSTAEKVTGVSGRGVGMDVVKSNLEKLGGTVEVQSELGKGTTIHVRLPLTLAILAALIIRQGEDRYAIPQVNIQELVRIKAQEVAERIQLVNDTEVLRLRGELLPLVRLDRALGMAPADESAGGHGPTHVVVVDTGHLSYGIIVDSMLDTEEIVVKPLGSRLKGCHELAGATILGDGRVAMILDVAGLAAIQSLGAVDRMADTRDSSEEGDQESTTMVLFSNGSSDLFAVPMGLVSRIERLQCDTISDIGGVDIYHYQDRSLPLLDLEKHVMTGKRSDQKRCFALVFSVRGRELGLLVAKIMDIMEVSCSIHSDTFVEKGIAGSFVSDGRTIRVLDLFELAESAHPAWFEGERAQEADRDTGSILLAEDSQFFRGLLTGYLQDAGFEVVACEDGAIAWDRLLAKKEGFALVITDVEMPDMNGLELCKRIKQHPDFMNLPVMAVTSLAGEADRKAGLEAGIDEYQIKVDRDALLGSVKRLLSGTVLAGCA